jgi:hypothetical protein
MVRILLFCTLLSPFFGNAQIKGKAHKLVGTWAYREGTGYEVWQFNGDKVEGIGYRNLKFGDTVKVEKMEIKVVNGVYTYSYKKVDDFDKDKETIFMSKGKNLSFLSVNAKTPTIMKYRFAFLSKNKINLKVTVGPKYNRYILTLYRVQ